MNLDARVLRLEQSMGMQDRRRFPEDCTCFPEDEQPEFKWRAEAEAAAKVLCPLHGVRFRIIVRRFLYRGLRFYNQDFERGWPHRSLQYQKAMRASFDSALWPVRAEMGEWMSNRC
jgi:hypothetical protein